MEIKNILSKIQCPDADWIGLREVRENARWRMARNGKISTCSGDTSHGIMVEVLKNGHIAYSATADRSAASVELAVQKALSLIQRESKYKVHHFTTKHRPHTTGRYHSPSASDAISSSDLNTLLIDACSTLRVSPKIQEAQAATYLINSKHRMVSTDGMDIEQDFSHVSFGYGATAVDGSLVQERSSGGFLSNSFQGNFSLPEQASWKENLTRTGQEALELLQADECPTGKMDLVLMPDQMMLQIHESIGHPLEIDRILGDERNYAGSSFVALNDFGTLTYGSPLMNISFDPTIKEEYASYAFDDNGQPAKKEYLIQEGKLLRGLGGLESQSRSDVPGVANARASLWNRPPIDRMANINLEPGTSSYDNIISGIEHGVIMHSNCSWSIDDFRRKFQFGCEYGKLVKNGKVVKTLRNPNYRGITVPFWKNLKKVGNEETWSVLGTPFCGKGEPNQVIRVGHASPVCLFENVDVFGGAEK